MKKEALFADRIGGAEYGKSTAIYKFEKIKRAKQRARELHPVAGPRACSGSIAGHVAATLWLQTHS